MVEAGSIEVFKRELDCYLKRVCKIMGIRQGSGIDVEMPVLDWGGQDEKSHDTSL